MALETNWKRVALGLLLAGCGGPSTPVPGTQNPGEAPKVDVGAPPSLAWVGGDTAFDDRLTTLDLSRWRASDGWVSSEDFNAGWRADHVRLTEGTLHLTLDTESCPEGCGGRPYASGEFASQRYHGYGRYEVRLKPARAPGTMTAFALTTGPFENTRWDEVGMAFLGKNPQQLRLTYISEGKRHDAATIDLPFDASESFHIYGLEWTRAALHWYVDGRRVHSETGFNGPLPVTPGRIVMNFWPGVGPATESWLGVFEYPGAPLTSGIQNIRHGPATPTDILEGFEAGNTAELWSPGHVDDGARVNLWQTDYGHQGRAMAMEYSVKANAHGAAERTFPSPMDWRGVRYLNFWFRGTATGDPFRLELRDNGPSPDKIERFEYRFQDDFVGWKWVSVPMTAFKRRTDWQPAGAPNDGLTLSAVRGLAFEPLGGDGRSVLFDDIQLER
ncbi:family 16 glycosylhydrolase [Archangium primigenium]|uniref:family 16 glycosylhydrolase n=1 Tax=[Archangium] primigenium TaxID=2792470 RepID=UPI0019567FF6|nr:family 16 glycosylhydrolase [Archangium primigenium]MBM7113288.1 family 16 glycosylhydrolase [Archangium primigenium]